MLQALPLKTLATDADAVADRTPARLHHIEKSLGGLNDYRAGRLGGAVQNDLAAKLQRQLLIGGVGNDAWFVADRHIHALRQRVRNREGEDRC